MSPKEIYVLSGGAGTRLWPFSREAFPKQFIDLTGEGLPLLALTLKRLKGFGTQKILTTQLLSAPTYGLVHEFGLDVEVIAEPAMRNTAPAVLLAALLSFQHDPKSLVGVFPADHVIRDEAGFRKALELAFQEAARGKVVTLGIQPTHPSTAYGYMELKPTSNGNGRSSHHPRDVVRFLEKPKEERARELIATGNVVWNAGIFVFPAAVMIELFKQHQFETWSLFQNLKPDHSNLAEIYRQVTAHPIDVAIMERLNDLVCIPVDMGWSDVGSWEEVAKVTNRSGVESETRGDDNFYTCLKEPAKKASFLGVSGVCVIDTEDAVLVMKKGDGQNIKQVVESLKASASTKDQCLRHSFELRPWGRFEILKDEEHYKSKKISVTPGQKLSYQSHEKRAEHWIMIRGIADVTLNGEVHRLKAGEHIYIPLRAKHRIANPGTEPLEFIEVQTGTYFGEDDITRYSDDYGRA